VFGRNKRELRERKKQKEQSSSSREEKNFDETKTRFPRKKILTCSRNALFFFPSEREKTEEAFSVMVRRASVAFLALVTTVGLTFLKHTVSATETSRRSLLQTDTFSYQNTGFCTRENVLYASVGIGCGALRDFAEEDEDRKNACCLILSELNEEKCFCENKVAPILQQSQANFVSMFVSAYDVCNGLEIYGGWKCSKFPRQAFLQPPPPPPSDESYPPYPPSPPSSPTSSETPPPRTETVDVCSIASQNPDSLLNQKCDKLPFLRENFEDRNPLSLLSRCCEQIEVLNSALCFCDERFQKVMNDNERKFRALFAAVPIKCRNTARMQIYYGRACSAYDNIGIPNSPPPPPRSPRLPRASPDVSAPSSAEDSANENRNDWSNVNESEENNNRNDLFGYWRKPGGQIFNSG